MKPPREGINWWPLYAVILIVCLGVAWKGFSAGGYAMLPVMFFVPLFGWVMARVIIGMYERAEDGARKARWEEWQGINYCYGPIQLRALEFEGALWFYEKDILTAANIRSDSLTRLFPAAERKPLEDTKYFVLSEAGIEHLLLRHPDPQAKQLLMHLRREAYFPFKRRKGEKVDVPPMR